MVSPFVPFVAGIIAGLIQLKDGTIRAADIGDIAQLQGSEQNFIKVVDINTSKDRSTATLMEEFVEPGTSLFVKNPDTPTGSVFIRFNSRTSTEIELTAVHKITGPFGSFFIRNESGAGILTLYISKGFGIDFIESSIATVSSIALLLTELTDVSVPSPNDNDVLKFDTTSGIWSSGTILAVELPDHASRHQDGGADEISIAGLSGEPADVVNKSLFDANTVLAANSDNTPAALTITEQTLVGRITAGNITALSTTQVRTLINVDDGADVTGSNPPQAHKAAHQDGGSDEISIAGLSGEPVDTVNESLFDANTILAATSDNTPAAITITEQTLVGRITAGNITALSTTQVRTLINVEDGSTADQTGAEIKTAYEGESNTNAFTDAEQTKLTGIATGADVTDATNVNAAGAVMETDYNANTILAATSDDTPVTLTVGEQTLVGRITSGNIAALTPSQIRTLINVEDGAQVNTSFIASGSYGGDDTADRAVAHGLGTTPKLVVIIAITVATWHIIVGNSTVRSSDGLTLATATVWDATNFRVGHTSSFVNSANASGTTYRFVAFG